jgi:tetratricopeptide (TPR) repeat protein
MTNNEITPLSFSHAFVLVTLGEVAQVQELLTQESALYTPLERVCLQAWMACKTALSAADLNEDEREGQWKEASALLHAAQVLSVLPGADAYLAKADGTVRRRRPWTLWALGNLVAHLGYPSVEPFREAVRLLDERRMNIPWLRIQVLVDLAQTLLALGSPHAALAHYEQALGWYQRVFSQQESAHEALPTIFIGLCETLGHLSEVERALDYGNRALAVCPPEQKWRTLSLLGGLHQRQDQLKEASAAYQEALAFARNAGQRLETLVALTRCALAGQHLSEAQHYRDLAVEEDRTSLPPRLRASLFRVCGDIAQLRATFRSEQPLVQLLREESIEWYCDALTALPGDPEVLSALTKLLLEMAERDGQVVQAAFWKKAYRVVMSPMSSHT